jgi:hypothetical protein
LHSNLLEVGEAFESATHKVAKEQPNGKGSDLGHLEWGQEKATRFDSTHHRTSIVDTVSTNTEMNQIMQLPKGKYSLWHSSE